MGCAFAGGATWHPHSAKAQTQEQAVESDAGNMTKGRFQLAHVFYSAAQQGTALVDSQTGRVWLLGYYKDKDANEIWNFNESAVVPAPVAQRPQH